MIDQHTSFRTIPATTSIISSLCCDLAQETMFSKYCSRLWKIASTQQLFSSSRVSNAQFQLYSSCNELQKISGYIDEFYSKLESVLSAEGVSRGESVRDHHSHDESHHLSQPPDAVVFPFSLEQLQAIARLS